MKNRAKDIINIALSLLLGGAILYWMYRDFDFQRVRNVLLHEMNWTWMLLSFPFGILAQAFRGWRWRQTLEPLGEQSRTSTRIYSIFLSYASSLVVPRIGEFARCGVLRRYDGVSFPKALGTVVSERVIDSLLVLLIAGLTFLWQLPVFMRFFDETGTSLDAIFHRFTTAGWIVTAVCGVAAYALIRRGLGDEAAYEEYLGKARAMAKSWLERASAGDYTYLTFEKVGWSMKYNMVWDKLLGLNLLEDSFYEKETKSYLARQNEFGLPLDSRSDYTKSDWILWSASMADEDTFRALVKPVAHYLRKSESRVAFSDWYFTSTGKYRAFIARSVQGGLYMPLLMDKWTGEAK